MLRRPPRAVRLSDRDALLPIVFSAGLRADTAVIRLEDHGAILGRAGAVVDPGRFKTVRLPLTWSARRRLARRHRRPATVTIVTGSVTRRAYRTLLLL